jgi:hypothetical protein
MRYLSYESFVGKLGEAAKVPVVVRADDGSVPDVNGPVLVHRYGTGVKQRAVRISMASSRLFAPSGPNRSGRDCSVSTATVARMH